MASANSTRFLDSSSESLALANKIFTGVVNEAARSATFLWDKDVSYIMRKNVEGGGKSFQYLRWGKLPEPENFEPGDEVLGQVFAVDEGTITTDKFLVAHNFVPQDHMEYAQFDVLARLGKSQGAAIGRLYDKRLFTLASKAARTYANTNTTKNGLNIHAGSNRVTRTGATVSTGTPSYTADSTGAANVRADLRSLALLMDKDNLIGMGRDLYIIPDVKNTLLFDTTAQVFSRDYMSGENNIGNREVTKLEGFNIRGIPNQSSAGGPMPNENLVDAALSKYTGNFLASGTNGFPLALAFAEGSDGGAALGVMTYSKIRTVVIHQETKLGYIVMSYLLVGADVMGPDLIGVVENTVS
jgi:hypothetical protein